jgi:hypothetical protein
VDLQKIKSKLLEETTDRFVGVGFINGFKYAVQILPLEDNLRNELETVIKEVIEQLINDGRL